MHLLSIPNVLSLSRIVLLPFLFIVLFLDLRMTLLISYIIIGATDYFDGKMARRLDQSTEFGKTLDGVADLFFYLSTSFFLFRLFPDVILSNFTILMIMFFEIGLSLVISIVKFRKLILMHTFLLKFNAVMVYFLFIFSFLFDTTIFTMVVVLLYIIAFFEEILIFIIFGEIDPDTKSIMHTFSIVRSES
jgi:phosphatidylglycerophosphate synthase